MSIQWFEDHKEDIRSWRRDLHQIPELGFEEFKTSAFVEARLQEWGVSYQSGIGKTGILAQLGPDTGPTVALRADMDGLPICEETNTPYTSVHEGKMHACGHDAHMAMLLGVVQFLKSIEQDLPGKVLCIFQPAEERADENSLTGARYFLNSGLLDGLRAVLGLHVISEIPAGQFAIIPGGAMASGAMYRATIHGKGGHDAWVHQTIDPIFLASQVLPAIYAIRGRKISPTLPGTISVGTIEGGTTANVIPEELHLTGTIRTLDEKTYRIFVKELEAALKIVEVLGGSYTLEIPFHVPEVKNDPRFVGILRKTCTDLFGSDSLFEFEPMMGVEDFSWYSHAFPSVFMMLGGKLPGELRPHHNPRFDIDDSILYRGSCLMAQSALVILRLRD
ncbi:MAG: amidohydrolase [Anaerolineales bacterium]|nr:amidohydrolase [Anaerolineales bacterium]